MNDQSLLWFYLGIFIVLVLLSIGLFKLWKSNIGETNINFFNIAAIKTKHAGVLLIFFSIVIFIVLSKKIVNEPYPILKMSFIERYAKANSQGERYRIIIEAANIIREKFREATSSLKKQYTKGDFKEIDELIDFLFSIDKENGHALYYSGLIKRHLEFEDRFKDRSHEDFFRYLEYEEKLSDSEKWGDIGGNVCYERAKGYCRQRTGSICHLLAWDYLVRGLSEANGSEDQKKFIRTSHNFAKKSLLYFPDGFVNYNKSTQQIEKETSGIMYRLKIN
jgi:hypothetical protein